MSLSFDGTSSLLEGTGLTAPGGVIGGPFTMFAWVKPSGTMNQGTVLQMKSGLNNIGIQIDDQWGTGNGGYGAGGSAFWYADRVVDAANWQPLMFVSVDRFLRKAYYKNVSTPYTEDTGLDISDTTEVRVGARNNGGSLGFWYSGLIAHVACWNAALSDSDFATLAGGAAPNTVQSGSLVDYWTLASNATTQTGVNGRVLTATSTSTGGSDPTVGGGGGGGGASLRRAMLLGLG